MESHCTYEVKNISFPTKSFNRKEKGKDTFPLFQAPEPSCPSFSYVKCSGSVRASCQPQSKGLKEVRRKVPFLPLSERPEHHYKPSVLAGWNPEQNCSFEDTLHYFVADTTWVSNQGWP